MTQEKWLIAPGQTKIIDVELVRSLKVSLIGGKVDVIGSDEPGARIEVHSVSGKDLKVSVVDDALEIDHPQLRWDNFIDVFASFRGSAKAEVSITVPRDVAMKFGVVTADALVTGLRHDAKLSTVSGDLVIDDITGDLELNGVNGEMSVRNHTGNILAHTVSGDITASGTIRRFTVDGVTSAIFLDIEGTPDEISTNLVSGSLTVRLGADVPTRYKINTVSGTLQLDNQTIRGTLGKGYDGSTGALNGAWLDLRANSVSGNISVVRRHTADVGDTGSSAGAAGDTAGDGASS
ncbi:hypothetical protein BJQ94_16720 [Cryobacterium sp. SO2]|uniref:DUF4097 family beta strand repeat-containing protein n=1 Tax=Cryobacterium sp. SO2 TaxID=1897060 RepID=UPI00223C92F3|nr:DUF4097 family beta strand repeat-containing protein [Cryobacterium sp. SO2]WEO76976.1 hypothetical protein BJQ94_16720 [Cryobacterium sp. SO2]